MMSKEFFLGVIIFVSGAVVMIVELAGTRILAPYLGTSIFIWTSLIGVVLACLSLGYWFGGRLADVQPRLHVLSGIMVLAAWAIAAIPLLKHPVLSAAALVPDIRFAAVLGSALLFGIPSVLLAAVSPYALRLAINDVAHSGRVAGRLSALSAIGSIVGTFCAGFFLLSMLGNTKTIIWVAIALVATAAFVGSKKLRIICAVSAAVFVLQMMAVSRIDAADRSRGIFEIETKYGWFKIFDSVHWDGSGKLIRVLFSGANEAQSAMFLDGTDDLAVAYTKYYRLAEHFVPRLTSALMIGGGAYSFPKDFVRRNPQAALSVVEIDGQLEGLAQKYFDLPVPVPFAIYNEDGRKFLASTGERYDVIYIDAFHNSFSIPHNLTTIEMVKEVFDHLDDGGVAMVNIIGSETGDNSRFLYSEYATYKSVFDSVYLLKINPEYPVDQPQNIMLVALKSKNIPSFSSENQEFALYLNRRFDPHVPAGTEILVDDVDSTYRYLR